MKYKRILVLFGLLALAGCGYPPLEDVEVPSDYTYIIGPGDSLEIFVWGNPDISRSIVVRPDGKITTPLVDDLLASGKTPFELAREVETELAKFVRDPQVAIIVGGFRGIYPQQIRIIGQINSGGSGGGGGGGGRGGLSGGGGARYSAKALPYTKEMTLLDLVIQLGGIGYYADGNGSSVIRMVEGEQKQYSVRIDDLLEDGDLTANVKILPGDILFIPEAFF